jgi:hypothetical protein
MAFCEGRFMTNGIDSIPGICDFVLSESQNAHRARWP